MRLTHFLHAGLLGAVLGAAAGSDAADLSPAIERLAAASGASSASPDLQQAWRRVAAGDPQRMTDVLAAMDAPSATAQNWLRTAADAMAERALESGDGFPEAELQQFLFNPDQPPRGRRAAYEWLVENRPELKAELLPKLLNDQSVELRYDAVAALMDKAEAASGGEQRELYEQAFASALNLKQLQKCAERLGELGDKPDIVEAMGFIADWKIIGPFDNVDGVGFDKAYPPEERVQLDATYPGKNGVVAWQDAEAEGALGEVDLTEPLGPEKGATAYLYATFDSPAAVPAQVRYASSNATKLWVNGDELASNQVYHAGNPLDQFRCPVELREGENTILVKVCQNEQTEGWAQAWDLQLRITDPIGKALLPATKGGEQ
ncbi:hypothetical protein Pla123a_26750 [Posidoniimonas polymericola]|uniref:HEAT repeat protein n=1 Tax=Posidoniimonas polymericola TaxID=2528002 RepID=A0A5C5YLQ4_9BACT|nr:hypothetical protein [Posidoniimonas polymericola]TWT75891.1 hypothetical protein Pla123a_26750 [Posidoniimonas polymericola]